MTGNTPPYRRIPPRIAVAGGAALASLLALTAGRSGISGAGSIDLALAGGGVAAFIVSGLMLARAALRETPPDPATTGRVRAAERPPTRHPDPDPTSGPGPNALLPVLRLVAAVVESGVGVEDEAAMRFALRLYVAGACDERASRLAPGPVSDVPVADVPVADVLSLLGDPREEAPHFAALLDDLLLAPANRLLYRAGRADMAAFLAGRDSPGEAFRAALGLWPDPHAGYAAGGPRMVVMAVASLPSGSAAAIEAVIGAFGGEAFSRHAGTLVATFDRVADAVAAARAIRDAGGPGCALTMLPAHARDGVAPRMAPLLALARAIPGEVPGEIPGEIAVTPVLRAALAASGDTLPCIRLEGGGGYLLHDAGARRQPLVRMGPASRSGPRVPSR
ncbi:MAG TPA: hypothetical protein VK943_07940 [Arenibaculum sp.]|nr:hypothetical protein [Arenibaculum sp.]